MLTVLGAVSGRWDANLGRERRVAGKLFARPALPRQRAQAANSVRSPVLRLDRDAVGNVSQKASGLTQEAFDSLLAFLGPNPEEAGKRYEEIRRRLIKIFTCRGCAAPEDLVDETIDRVARKAAELAPGYEGDPASYFYGVARWVFIESLKKRPYAAPPPEPDSSEESERELDCLEGCMGSLPPEQSAFIRDYYREDKSAKIDQRKSLAERMGIGINALRIRAHRIRAELYKCVSACLQDSAEEGPT